VPRATGAPGPARDVAIVSGRAALERALLLQQRHRDAEAIGSLAQVERDYGPLMAVVLPARTARIDALTRGRRFDEELAERFALAAMDPVDPMQDFAPQRPVLVAPLELASRLRSEGRDAEADAALHGAEQRIARALGAAHGNDLVALADALSRVRAARHDAPGALAALRAGLAGSDPSRVPFFARTLATRAFEAGAPDSVFAYARWAASLNGSREVAGWAWYASAQAWEELSAPDSAIADYDAILRQWPDPGFLGPITLYRESLLLERVNQWERALAGYNTLQARYPTDPLAFDAARRIVRHHLDHGQPEMAQVAGEQTLRILAHLLVTDLDPLVQREALSAEADVQLALQHGPEAEATLLDLWLRFPEDSLAQDAGLRAARLARARPGGAARADSILEVLKHTASNAAVRRAAAAGGAIAKSEAGGGKG
jgi:tetratricopeptide (TPR) repeat protein